MSELEELLGRITGFYDLNHVDKTKVFGWYLQSVEENARFSGRDILRCFDMAQVKRPANISKLLKDLIEKKPPQLLRDRNGYFLERSVRTAFDGSLGQRGVSIQIGKLIEGLPSSLTSAPERAFLEETLVCYKHGAFRAAVVMMWNLAYAHFCEWLLRLHASAFNSQWPIRFPEQHKRAKVKTLAHLDHFGELKESEVIDVARSAGLISQSIHKTLSEKLGKRNTAAHPSTHTVTQIQVEEVIHDLVVNVMQKLLSFPPSPER